MTVSSAGRIRLSFAIALTGLFAGGCLGLKGHKRNESDTATNTTDPEQQTCSGINCWKPDKNKCARNGELEVFAPSGYCSGGDCFYASRQSACPIGVCEEGVCVSTPFDQGTSSWFTDSRHSDLLLG